MASIDLAKYVARVEADTSGLKSGLSQADNMVKSVLDGAGLKTKLTMAAIATAIGVTIKKSVDSFVEFENEMNKVYTLLPDMSKSAMTQMEQQVKNLSKEMGVLPNDLIPALYQSLSASVPKENVFDFLEVAQKGAIAGMASTERTVDALTTVLNSYHMEATQAEKISDIMFQTIKYGKTSMDELSASLSQVTPIASTLGVEFGDVSAAIATMTAQGNSTAASTTQLKQMFSELSKEGTKTSDVFKEISGKSFKEFIAEGHNVNDALQLMEEYARANGLEINDLFSSVQAGQAALMLTGESAEMFAENIENMGNSAGATDQAFETMEQGIGRSFERIKVNMHMMLLELGENLAPAVKNAADYIEEAMPNIQFVVETVFMAIGEVIKAFVVLIDWLVDNLKQFVIDNEEILNDVFETFKDIFKSIIEIAKSFIELFQVLWDKYGENIKQITTTIWDTVSRLFQNGLNIIEGILDFFIGLFTGDWDRMKQGFITIVSNMWDSIKTLFSGSLQLIKDIMSGFINILTGVAKSIMSGIWNGFKSIWSKITEWVSDKFNSLVNTVLGFTSRFYNAGRDMFSSAWDGMKSIWTNLYRWVSDKVSWLADKLAFWRRSEKEMGSSNPRPRGRGGTPSYDVGTPFVPSDQLAFIHKGEAIIPAKYNPYNPANSGKFKPMSETTKTEHHYHISKLEFPNVRDSSEIENAIKNLSTYAHQWVNKR